MTIYKVTYADFYGVYEGSFLLVRATADAGTPPFDAVVNARLHEMFGADAVFTWSFAERVLDSVVETSAL